ncbi:MAG: IS110 family transposase [Caldilinea sp.]|nr:IS110 family transposase [Caldilinea sp.]
MTIYIGIDWSREKHDVTYLNEKGAEIETQTVRHDAKGFEQLDKVRRSIGVGSNECVVGIESAHTVLIDFLWAKGYEQIYVIPPAVINANRRRNRQSGARNDRYDSLVIAETLLTDRHKFYPWRPGSERLQQMRRLVSQGEFWTTECTRVANRLEAELLRYYPEALAVFPSWPTALVCHFVLAFPTPQAAKRLSLDEFKAFARQHHYPKPRLLSGCYDRLIAAHPEAQPATVSAGAMAATPLAEALLHALQHKQRNRSQLKALFDQHPDAALFGSLPGVGDWLAPALLVKFGEDRQRFPSAEAVQVLAGTCPVTYQSGKKRSVRFRRSCDHSFRQIAQLWARSAVAQSDWAASYFKELTSRRLATSHAYRCLANRLIAIAWRLWQDRILYDEAVHLQNRARRRRPLA